MDIEKRINRNTSVFFKNKEAWDRYQLFAKELKKEELSFSAWVNREIRKYLTAKNKK